jgi:hypothetical protein
MHEDTALFTPLTNLFAATVAADILNKPTVALTQMRRR